MAEVKNQYFSLPCRVKACKFTAGCRMEQFEDAPREARAAIRKALSVHWAWHHSSPEDRAEMLKQRYERNKL